MTAPAGVNPGSNFLNQSRYPAVHVLAPDQVLPEIVFQTDPSGRAFAQLIGADVRTPFGAFEQPFASQAPFSHMSSELFQQGVAAGYFDLSRRFLDVQSLHHAVLDQHGIAPR